MADRHIVLGDKSLNAFDVQYIQKADAVILPQESRPKLYGICKESQAALFPCYTMRYRYSGKVRQAAMFQEYQIPYPTTFLWQSVEEFRRETDNNLEKIHSFPFVLKADQSHEGTGVYFVDNSQSLSRALNQLAFQEDVIQKGFLSQDWIPCGANVLRVVVMGRRFFSYWKRPSSPHDFVTTVGKGAEIDHEWRPDLQSKGQEMARYLSTQTGINLAALDMVFPLSEIHPFPQCLEINYYFGRRGFGGLKPYYELLLAAVKEWLTEQGLNPDTVSLA